MGVEKVTGALPACRLQEDGQLLRQAGGWTMVELIGEEG